MAPPYVTYNSGLDSKHLHLGNLVHDFKNPANLDPYEEKSYTDISSPPPIWATATPLSNYALTLGKDEDGKQGLHKYRVVASNKALKLDINEPEKYFTNVTLISPAAKKWLTSRLSALTSSPSKPPKVEIWLLTSIILFTHATWTSISSPEVFKVGEAAPFDPSSVNQLRRLSASGDVKPVVGLEKGREEEEHRERGVGKAEVLETGKYPGTRAWAARWVRVDVSAGEGGDGELKLVGKAAGKSVEVGVDEEDAGSWATNGGVGVEGDDEFWEGLLDRAEELM